MLFLSAAITLAVSGVLFNSFHFALFFPVVFFLYWFVFKKLSHQNLLLLAASYFFYACWDVRFLLLLMFSTFLDYYTGIRMYESRGRRERKTWFWLSIGVNLGFLGFFKYYNFFVESFADALASGGIHIDVWTLNVILPVGISFYTFHGLSYVIDIYYGRIKPERNVVEYSVFVSFFPLLVAGPIERATHLLPQIKRVRKFDYGRMVDGLRQILWGLFKKIVIADNCAQYANQIFGQEANHSGSTLAVGAVFFAFQIYCDFSGYSDIALGVARLLGVELLRNFAFPYFSRDIAEFWRRWHISLSTWFRDYLYIPLGGSKGGTWMKVRNTFVIFLVSGFWHGANWTFIVWGLLNALYFLPLLLSDSNRNNMGTVATGRLLPSLREFVAMIVTFSLTVFAWIFFRAENLTDAFAYIGQMCDATLFTKPEIWPVPLLVVLAFFVLVEWFGREQQYALARLGCAWPQPVRWSFYYALIVVILMFMGKEQEFIYFQF